MFLIKLTFCYREEEENKLYITDELGVFFCQTLIILTTYKMFNLDDITTKNDNTDWPYRKLIIGPSGSGKTKIIPERQQHNS